MTGTVVSLIVIISCTCLLVYVVRQGSVPGLSYTVQPIVVDGSVFVNGTASVATTDEDFICVTLDYGPPEVWYDSTCWGNATLFTLNLSNPVLFNAVKAFSPLVIRIGGTLQDLLVYQTDINQGPCDPQTLDPSGFLGFSEGCLPMSRWDELNDFIRNTGAIATFGLNALYGRTVEPDGSVTGPWNSTNAEALLQYTVQRGYNIHGWELGNKLSGKGIGASLTANQYASDMQEFQDLVDRIYVGFNWKPLILAPGGFFDYDWFDEFVHLANGTLQVISLHIYNLGPGADSKLKDKILSPSYLDRVAQTFSALQTILIDSGSSATAWVSEAGGAINSGRHLVTDAFMSSFWYLDQLGIASIYKTKKFCRQTLIGGGYGLLNSSTFQPNPDYYSALLWDRLMGSTVLSTSFTGIDNIRAYSHCSKNSMGITLLLINLDETTTVKVGASFQDVSSDGMVIMHLEGTSRNSKVGGLSTGSTSIGKAREEYHLMGKDGDPSSQVTVLNGRVLHVNSSGIMPHLHPKRVRPWEPIVVAPFSVVFVRFRRLNVTACRKQ